MYNHDGDLINWVHVWLIVQTYEAAERARECKRTRPRSRLANKVKKHKNQVQQKVMQM